MDYEQFVSAVVECAEKELGSEAVVERQRILKNNGVYAEGIVIRKPGGRIAPVIYLDGFYRSYRNGESMDYIAGRILEQFRSCPEPPEWDFREILDFGCVREKIVYKLVNAEKNQNLLKQVPHLPVLDLAIVFYLMISEGAFQNCSVLIKNDHMDLWKIPMTVLYEAAKENTPKLCPYVLRPLADFLGAPEEVMPEGPIFVLTNELGINGAAALLYPHLPEYIFKQTGGNYYLLPSSVHEFLIVPEKAGISGGELLEMVKEINGTEVDVQDLLSDHIYYFNGDIITKM